MSRCPYGCLFGKMITKKRYKYCIRTYCSSCGRWIRGDEEQVINLGKIGKVTCRRLNGVIVKGNCLVLKLKRNRNFDGITIKHKKWKVK